MFTILTCKWFVNKEDYHDVLDLCRENTVTILAIPVCGNKPADFCWENVYAGTENYEKYL